MSKNHRKKRDKSSRSRSQSVSSFLENSKENASIANNENTFKIKTSKVMGRYMVATRELTPGSVVLSELPLVVGPCTGCKVQCIGCYQTLEECGPYSKCKNCGWPLCCANCPGYLQRYGHLEIECEVLRNCKSSKFLDYNDFSSMADNLYALVPLRCLIMKTTNSTTYEKLMDMEAHNEIRKNIPHLWSLNQTTVVDKIRKDWNLTEFSEEEIHSICGILEVNAFEIGQQGVSIRGLYPTAFLMSHDCVPNTNHSDEEKDYRLTVRASTTISSNHPITLSYAYTLQSTLKRRQHLLENKFFECYCKRCSDPTELGTYAGALRCPKCKNGWVLSSNPLDADAPWCCINKSKAQEQKCPGYTVTAKSMALLIARITDEVEALDCNDVVGMEKFLEKYRNVLHPTNYLCLKVKLSLSQLYGKINGYIIHELSDELLMRKENICKEIIKIFDIIEPGFTRLRGVTLYELHAPIMILTTRQFEQQLLSKTELRHRLKEVVMYLEEASIILGFEPDTSPEGIMGIAAKSALVKIKNWGKVVGKM